MKQTPIRIYLDTLGDLIARKEEGLIGGLEAWCHWGSCGRGGVALDLAALAKRFGPDYDWKRLQPVCRQCGRLNNPTSISLR